MLQRHIKIIICYNKKIGPFRTVEFEKTLEKSKKSIKIEIALNLRGLE
jgi:hypothetical protein